ncbi:hypothetical protein DY000_02032128 [Brassica cretica]|uniref:Uncharacterized protein n=1 Tax=Brassica cretica TaxID=69181 RepID=A0ABQ7DPZ0_BRACR|nr:hypothetical protein DY000_02032128 [Brassica cretica]
MYPIKARNRSIFELDKLHQSAKRNFRTAMVGSGQVLLDSDKTVELLESQKGEKLELERLGARGGGYGLRAASRISGNERTREKTHREKSPIKRELSIFGWIDQVRVKNDRLWGESDFLNVRRPDGNRSRGVRRDRIKQNIPTLRQRSGPDPKG